MKEKSGGRGGSQAQKTRSSSRRKNGSGGIVPIAEGVWRVDVEVARDAVTGRRRRVSRRVNGTRRDAELVAAKLRLADHERRLVTGRTSARTVRDVLDEYITAIVSRCDGIGIEAVQVTENHLGRTWQRWSRHIGSQWRPGTDGLRSYMRYVHNCIQAAAK